MYKDTLTIYAIGLIVYIIGLSIYQTNITMYHDINEPRKLMFHIIFLIFHNPYCLIVVIIVS